ncbi:hypothetical protein YC2023_021051 [Brassica napus]
MDVLRIRDNVILTSSKKDENVEILDGWGHESLNCGFEGISEENQEVVIEVAKVVDVSPNISQDTIQKEDEKESESTTEGNISIQKTSNNFEKKGEEEKEWLTVSPGRMSRTPSHSDLEVLQQSILTKSRFSVLMEDQEERGEKDNEDLLEEEDQENEKEEEEVIPRKMLPRESKVNHRYFKDKVGQKTQDADPSSLNKKKTRRQ